MHDFGLYIVISNPNLKYTDIAELCVKHNIKMLQLREKNKTDKEILKIAKDIRNITKGTNTRFVINDRIDIATIVEADYIHVGQDDLQYDDIRKVNKKIKAGISNHSIAQLKQSLKKDYDYFAFGPIFSTPTKPNYKEVGIKNLVRAVNMFVKYKKPLVAIGGIFDYNLNDILSTGIKNICMVRYFMESKTKREFEEKIKKINELLKNKL